MRRGLSLAEVLVSISLLLTLMGLTFYSLRPAQAAQHSTAVVEVLAEKFRATRDAAMSTGIPHGLGFDGSSAGVQSLYQLSGEQRGRWTSAFRWDPEFPLAGCFCGYWNGSGSWQAMPDVPGTVGLELASWAPRPADRLFVYMPSGRLISNQPCLDGACYLVVGMGLRSQPGSVAGVPVPRLTGVHRAQSLRLGLAGEIQVVPGVPGATGLADTPGEGLARGLVARNAPINEAPQLLEVLPRPLPIPGTLPDGIDASVSPGGYITFTAYAVDAQADRLSCGWSTDRGAFSSTTESEMEYLPQAGKWVAHWTFTPPPSANVRDEYLLRCRVQDAHGETDEGTFGVNGRVLVTRRQKLVYTSDVLSGDRDRPSLFVCNTDGTERRLLFDPGAAVMSPRWSADGSFIIFLRSFNNHTYDCCRINADGTDFRVLLPAMGYSRGIWSHGFSFDGTRVLAAASTESTFDLWSIDVDGLTPPVKLNPFVSGPQFPTTVRNMNNAFQVHPRLGHLLLAANDGTLFFVNPTTRESFPVVQSEYPPGMEFCFTADGNQLYYTVGLNGLRRANFRFAGGVATLEPGVALNADEAQTPTMGMDPEFIYYQRRVTPGDNNIVRVAKYSTTLNDWVDLSNFNQDEDECWVTGYPDVELEP